MNKPAKRPVLTLRVKAAKPKPAKPGATKQERRARLERLINARKWLDATYPAVFGSQPKPLAVGIGKQILQSRPETVPHRALSGALYRHTRSKPYLRALAAGGDRFDLEGNSSGMVSEPEQQQAIAALELAETKAAATQAKKAGD